ncbi:LysR family transcriptional regulator [Vibrio sp. UCD-FRSSP16_10]|uniref:LysR family transcriptional regulator n=1 Tax=unclassified Vibrio TaxID=2614977 RepID=UPI0008002A2E|nr:MULTISPECIES: LysR family transcriptional regulator [unclassified Vibrio]OBT09407.1 LysR family transcriptional regulator [Vibrio sp. UCD-FRSSP16_30]OBT22086.1 LysR family transcriptional regulator [Vibrio sp. UCD-FRSSP16_10]
MKTTQLMALLPDLATYTLVVQQGNFTNAANSLAMTPSAVSKTITRLEKALEVKLIERTTRNFRITEEGNKVYEQAIQMLNAAEQAVELSSIGHSQAQGSILISAPEAFLAVVLQPLIIEFLKQYPNIQIKARAIDGAVDIYKQGIDVAFKLTEQPDEQLVLKELGQTQLLLCASKPYLMKHGKPTHPSDLIHHNCLYLAETQHDNVWTFHKDDLSQSVTVSGRYAVNQAQLRFDGVKNHLGIGLFHDFVIENAVQHGEVVQVLEDWTITSNHHGNILMQYAQTKYMPARLRLFIDFINHSLNLNDGAKH